MRLIRDKEYSVSESEVKFGSFEDALRDFPKKEKGGFITSIEKSWLTVWTDPDQETLGKNLIILQKLIKTIEDRQFLSLSREANFFLFPQ